MVHLSAVVRIDVEWIFGVTVKVDICFVLFFYDIIGNFFHFCVVVVSIQGTQFDTDTDSLFMLKIFSPSPLPPAISSVVPRKKRATR